MSLHGPGLRPNAEGSWPALVPAMPAVPGNDIPPPAPPEPLPEAPPPPLPAVGPRAFPPADVAPLPPSAGSDDAPDGSSDPDAPGSAVGGDSGTRPPHAVAT